ncbi:non-specific lipid-transfer protein 2-like [Impatiens glandulifera]|uniref:non-specific lipid-transfer protein 2-like n=1 Tax=Impatiens glandulifera TaxID=253017 RepID=UPI001FB075E9|nr:non-specific lipid-transfer protein 2-like [Impatiens glandulifera]
MKVIASSSYLAVQASLVLVLILILQEGAVNRTMAATISCKAMELSPCAVAIVSAKPPSAVCCRKIKQQRPCLCQYLKDPNLKKFVNSPNARKVAVTCGTPYPRC